MLNDTLDNKNYSSQSVNNSNFLNNQLISFLKSRLGKSPAKSSDWKCYKCGTTNYVVLRKCTNCSKIRNTFLKTERPPSNLCVKDNIIVSTSPDHGFGDIISASRIVKAICKRKLYNKNVIAYLNGNYCAEELLSKMKNLLHSSLKSFPVEIIYNEERLKELCSGYRKNYLICVPPVNRPKPSTINLINPDMIFEIIENCGIVKNDNLIRYKQQESFDRSLFPKISGFEGYSEDNHFCFLKNGVWKILSNTNKPIKHAFIGLGSEESGIIFPNEEDYSNIDSHSHVGCLIEKLRSNDIRLDLIEENLLSGKYLFMYPCYQTRISDLSFYIAAYIKSKLMTNSNTDCLFVALGITPIEQIGELKNLIKNLIYSKKSKYSIKNKLHTSILKSLNIISLQNHKKNNLASPKKLPKDVSNIKIINLTLLELGNVSNIESLAFMKHSRENVQVVTGDNSLAESIVFNKFPLYCAPFHKLLYKNVFADHFSDCFKLEAECLTIPQKKELITSTVFDTIKSTGLKSNIQKENVLGLVNEVALEQDMNLKLLGELNTSSSSETLDIHSTCDSCAKAIANLDTQKVNKRCEWLVQEKNFLKSKKFNSLLYNFESRMPNLLR